jgi:hypothetical protein
MTLPLEARHTLKLTSDSMKLALFASYLVRLQLSLRR